MMSRELQFLLSGPGLIGRQHARLIAERSDCRLAAVVAPPSAENKEFAHRVSARFYTSIKEALDYGGIDAAIISSPNSAHFEQTLECVLRRIPTLVEKPMTGSISEALALVEAVGKTGTPVLVGHHRTYSTLLDTAREFLTSREFGRLVALQGSALFFKPDQYFVDGPWRTVLGGGPILINLIHEIGLMREFAGEVASVQAISGRHIRDFEVEDTVSIALEFKRGALGTFLLSDAAASSKSWEMTSGENPAYPHFPLDTCYHFAGTNASLDFPSMKVKMYSSSSERSWWNPFREFTLNFQRLNPLALQLDHFVRVTNRLTTPRVSAEDGCRNILVVDAIQRAIKTRRAVDLDP